MGINLVNESEGGKGNLNRKVEESTKQLMSDLMNSKQDPVYQFDLNGTFIKKWDYPKQASDYLGYKDASGITKCLRETNRSYKGFLWSKTEIPPVKNNINNLPTEKGYKHGLIARLIKIEENILKNDRIFIYKDNKLVYDSVGMYDCAEWLKNTLNSTLNNASLKSRISSNLKSGCLYNGYKFSREYPNIKLRDRNIFKFFVYKNDELIANINGVNNLCESIFNFTKKYNVINLIKGKTNFLIHKNFKFTLKIKLNLSICRLYKELYRELETKIGESCDANPEVIIDPKKFITP